MNSDFIAEALTRMRADGLVLDAPITDGQLHRCGTEGKENGKDGAYRFHIDDMPVAWWINWRTTDKGTTYCAKSASEMTSEEHEEFKRRIAEIDEIARKKREKQNKAAQKSANYIWDKARPAEGKHPYLERKQVEDSGLEVDAKGNLLIPVFDKSEHIQSLQFIAPQKAENGFEKWFLKGGNTKGGFYPIQTRDGEENEPLLIAEGYATGMSAHMATGYTCFIAFYAGNMPAVAKMAREQYPTREICLCADYDIPQTDKEREKYPAQGGIGVASARAAAKSICAYLAIPYPIDGGKSDFNDIHCRDGLASVQEAINKALAGSVESNQAEENTQAVEILSSPPNVPLEAFPPEIAELLKEAAEGFTVPLQIPVACFLGYMCALVGRSRLISIKESWSESGNLYIVLVAKSGTGKTPVMKAFFDPLHDLEHEARKKYESEREDYEQKLSQWNCKYKKESGGQTKSNFLDDGQKPKEPKQKQISIDDATIEAVADTLNDNPKGIIWNRDELAGLIADFDRYSPNAKGATKSRLLSAYDCQPWKQNRASNQKRNVYIKKACLSLFSGVQPEVMSKVFESERGEVDSTSGFLARFIFIRAEHEKPQYWTENPFSEQSKTLLKRIAAHLWQWEIETDCNGKEIDKVISLSPEAKELYIKWYNQIEDDAFLSDNGEFLKKLKGQAQRICLLLHCLDAALAGMDGMNPISYDCMKRALLLAGWIREHKAQCWKLFQRKKPVIPDPVQRAIMEVCVDMKDKIAANGNKISTAELADAVRKRLEMPISNDQVGRACSKLELHSCWLGRNRGREVKPEKMNLFLKT